MLVKCLLMRRGRAAEDEWLTTPGNLEMLSEFTTETAASILASVQKSSPDEKALLSSSTKNGLWSCV